MYWKAILAWTISVYTLHMSFSTAAEAQVNLAPNPSFDSTAQGKPPCQYSWDNDGPCAAEYLVQRYPDAAFEVSIESLDGNNAFAVNVINDEAAPEHGSPRAQLKYQLPGVQSGEVYELSAAVHTDQLLFDTFLRAIPRSPNGPIHEATVVQHGPRQTAPWQRVALRVSVPDGATAIDFQIYVSGEVGRCPGECGSAYFDDLSITRVDNLLPNSSFTTTAQGSPPCLFTWENDGPCAPEYLVQQNPAGDFEATVETVDGDNVFAVHVDENVAPATSGNPRALLKHNLTDLTPGERYSFSAAVRTEALSFATSLRATPLGDSGAITEARVIQPGPNGTTPWQRIALEIMVPEDADEVAFAIYVSGPSGSCSGGTCGSALFDDLSITRMLDHPFSNVCPEGQYLDWAHSGRQCKDLEVDLAQLAEQDVDVALDLTHQTGAGNSTLDVSRIFDGPDRRLGFKPTAFVDALALAGVRDQRHQLTTCTELALQELLDELELLGGGIITLPACEIAVSGQLRIPSRIVLQGAGIGRTLLHPTDPWTGRRFFEIRESSHIIIRDLTVDLMHRADPSASPSAFFHLEADNVLLERVEARNAKLNSFNFRLSRNFTVRYSVGQGNQGHALATSDCRIPGQLASLDECLAWFDDEFRQINGGPPQWRWIANHSVYSNLVANNQGSGINTHGVLAEIAGNRIHNNLRGSKFTQARYIWVHDNEYRGTELRTLRVQHAFLAFRPPLNVLIYRNHLVDNGWGYGAPPDTCVPTPNLIDFTDPDYPQDFGPVTYLIMNTYQSNLGRLLGRSDDPLCEGSGEVISYPTWGGGEPCTLADWHHRWGFSEALPADHPTCQLDDIHTIFPLEP